MKARAITATEEAIIKAAGPYRVQSQGCGNLLVTPEWPEFPTYNIRDGGGPGLLSRMQLARVIEKTLNVIPCKRAKRWRCRGCGFETQRFTWVHILSDGTDCGPFEEVTP